MWESIAEIQVFREEFHTHIHLDYISVEFLSCIQKKKKKKKKKTNNNTIVTSYEIDAKPCYDL